MNSGKRGRNDRDQGEGDFDADRRYRSDGRKFVRTSDVRQADRNAKPSFAVEPLTLAAVERTGRDRSMGADQTDFMKIDEWDSAYNDPQ